MLSMILRMTGITLLYVLVTVLIWKKVRDRDLNWPQKLFIGLVYGGASVLSTHFGVDYSHMLLNVRDLGPLISGLFFDRRYRALYRRNVLGRRQLYPDRLQRVDLPGRFPGRGPAHLGAPA